MSGELKTRLIQFMILNRIYWTPSKLYKVKLIQTRECWRCHNGEGMLTHMLWSCPKIQDFWSEIHKNVTKIIARDVPFSQRLYILGDLSLLEDLSSRCRMHWCWGVSLSFQNGRPPLPPLIFGNHLGRLVVLEGLSYRLMSGKFPFEMGALPL